MLLRLHTNYHVSWPLAENHFAQHIPRYLNGHADALANLVLDERQDFSVWHMHACETLVRMLLQQSTSSLAPKWSHR